MEHGISAFNPNKVNTFIFVCLEKSKLKSGMPYRFNYLTTATIKWWLPCMSKGVEEQKSQWAWLKAICLPSQWGAETPWKLVFGFLGQPLQLHKLPEGSRAPGCVVLPWEGFSSLCYPSRVPLLTLSSLHTSHPLSSYMCLACWVSLSVCDTIPFPLKESLHARLLARNSVRVDHGMVCLISFLLYKFTTGFQAFCLLETEGKAFFLGN